MNTTHTAFFGDAEYKFHLTDEMVEELERITGSGIGTLFIRLVAGQFHAGDLNATLRLGLIGGGTDPKRAQELVSTYAANQPYDRIFPLCLDVLSARWTGTDEVAA